MKASFHVAGDLDIEIEPVADGKLVRLVLVNPFAAAACVRKAGDNPPMAQTTAPHSGRMHLDHPIEECVYLGPRPSRHFEPIHLSKSAARSIASAIMGAAAEL